MNLTDLQTFLLVGRTQSMAAVARSLGVPRSTVSRRVARLEDDLGYPLLARGGRKTQLTDHGRLIEERCGPALRDLEDVQRLLSDAEAEPTGTLKISTSFAEATSPAFARLVARYRELHPEVDVEVHIGGRNVDLVEEGFDLAMRPGGPRAGGHGLMRRRLGTTRSGFYSNPRFLEQHEQPDRLEDVDGAHLVVHRTIYEHARLGVAGPQWSFYGSVPAATRIDDLTVVAQVLAAGYGVGMLPAYLAAPHVANGLLVELWPGRELPTMYFHLLWPQSRHLSVRVRRFIDLAIETLAPNGELLWD